MERADQLGKRIRDLCGRVVDAEGVEFDHLVVQLRQALREHFIETQKLLLKSYPRVGIFSSKKPPSQLRG